MIERTVRGVRVPGVMYGTAWKEDRTQELVEEAFVTGYRAFDTANQRKHYHEAAVGEALRGRERGQLFLQTKFTHRAGQDHRLPYDAVAPIGTQVEQSFGSSLAHLHTTYVDAYVLHGPSTTRGLAPEDVDAWRAMERLHDTGAAHLLGVSNVTRDQLEQLCGLARVPPAFVQNRCHATRGWDADVRALCRRRDVTYQGFSLLTANRATLARPLFDEVMHRTGKTREQIVFRFAVQVGMLPLTGTSSPQHMRDDLAIDDFELTEREVEAIERAGAP
ncbi:MAG: aldo/keto reductase [Deltaproteobacteria bacterium]|nr:aldo/keto reductase [Deltaproteobacteria bacterium]